jgi:hypothetical protein
MTGRTYAGRTLPPGNSPAQRVHMASGKAKTTSGLRLQAPLSRACADVYRRVRNFRDKNPSTAVHQADGAVDSTLQKGCLADLTLRGHAFPG